MKGHNLRKMTVTSSTGKDRDSTQVLDGHAKKSSVANVTNETSQYMTGKTEKGSLGGMNTNS
jgi:hypothetical protein